MANTQVMQRIAGQYAEDQGKYRKAVNQFNFDADVYNKQLNEYKALVDAYNSHPEVVAYDNAVKNYNTNLLPAYQTQVADYNKKVTTWQNGSVTMDVPMLGSRTTTPEKMYNMLNSYSGNRNQVAGKLEYLKNNFYPGAAPSAPTQPTAPKVQKPGDFTAVKPELTAEAPKDPGFTKGQMDALMGKQTVAQQERSKDSGLVAGAQAALQDARNEGSMIGGLLARARYST